MFFGVNVVLLIQLLHL